MKNLNCYFIRHGEAWSMPGTPDEDRSLTETGRVQAGALAAWFGEKEFVAILSSPAVRAVTTAQLLVANRQNKRIGVVTPLFRGNMREPDCFSYCGQPLNTLEGDVLIVGHQNRLQGAVNLLTNRHPAVQSFAYSDAIIPYCRGVIVRFGASPEDVTLEKIEF